MFPFLVAQELLHASPEELWQNLSGMRLVPKYRRHHGSLSESKCLVFKCSGSH